jgi:hypothetical protein
MTPREFRQDKELEFDHFQELTSTGIKPNYVNIELFAHEYHQAKLKLLGIADVSQQRELLPEFLYTFEETIRTGVIGNSDVTAEWNEYLKNLGNCG